MQRKQHNFKNQDFPLKGLEFVKGPGFANGFYVEEGQLLVTAAIKYVANKTPEEAQEVNRIEALRGEAIRGGVSLDDAKAKYPIPVRETAFNNLSVYHIFGDAARDGGAVLSKGLPIGKNIISAVAAIKDDPKTVQRLFDQLIERGNFDPKEKEQAFRVILPFVEADIHKAIEGSHTGRLLAEKSPHTFVGVGEGI